MGLFGDILSTAQKHDGIGMGISSGLQTGVGNAVSSIFGLGYNQRLKKQVKAQKQLMDHSAKLSYDYNEQAAENAYERQMKMYQRSYEDRSYKAIRKQMEDADLSIGLMYGGSGSGGGQGSTSGAPQGQAAVSGGNANANIADIVQMGGLGLQLKGLQKDLQLKDAQINEINATAEAKRAEAGLASEKKITEMQSREATIRDIFETGKSKWITNLRALYEDTTESGENDTLEATDDFYGEHSIIGKRMKNQEFANDIMLKQAKAAEALGNEKAAKALAALNDEKKKYLYKEVLIAAQHADAHSMEAAAKKLATEWQTGEYANWKTWSDLGMNAVKMLGTVIGGFGLGKSATVLKRAFESRQSGGRIGTILDSAGKPISWETW